MPRAEMLYFDWRFSPVFDLIDPNTAYSGANNTGLVLLSVIVATLAAVSISGRLVAANSRGARRAWANAGAAAMEARALLRYDPGLVFVSLGIGVHFRGVVSSRVMVTVLAAPLMGFAVAGMHYAAMQASSFFSLPEPLQAPHG